MTFADFTGKFWSLLKEKTIPSKLAPKVSIDYQDYGEHHDALLAAWEELLPELEASGGIRERKMNDYGDGYKYETMRVYIGGVKVELSGPHYPSEPSRANEERRQFSPEERADSVIDNLTRQTELVWAMTTCSQRKADSLYAFVAAAAGKRGVDPELVRQVTDDVLRVLQVKALTGGKA